MGRHLELDFFLSIPGVRRQFLTARLVYALTKRGNAAANANKRKLFVESLFVPARQKDLETKCLIPKPHINKYVFSINNSIGSALIRKEKNGGAFYFIDLLKSPFALGWETFERFNLSGYPEELLNNIFFRAYLFSALYANDNKNALPKSLNQLKEWVEKKLSDSERAFEFFMNNGFLEHGDILKEMEEHKVVNKPAALKLLEKESLPIFLMPEEQRRDFERAVQP
jgi:hypothetical protein